jgi:hypothetical protein
MGESIRNGVIGAFSTIFALIIIGIIAFLLFYFVLSKIDWSMLIEKMIKKVIGI